MWRQTQSTQGLIKMTETITHKDLHFEECMEDVKISIPEGHAYTNKDIFYLDVFDAISDEYEINGYNKELLYIKSCDAIYSGACACNAFVQNSIMDMFEEPYSGTFHAVDDDDKENIITDFFD